MKQQDLDLILSNHDKWLKGQDDGERADLRNANLRNADLRNANLRNADLCNANLRNANLRNANLCNADLRNANLCNANLCSADLYNANLCSADLYNADLCNANPCSADRFVCDGNFHHITNIGSEHGTLELYSCGKKGWFVRRGCFRGSSTEFIDKVEKTHGDNEHAIKYKAIIEVFCK